jgi:hypothetical protein
MDCPLFPEGRQSVGPINSINPDTIVSSYGLLPYARAGEALSRLIWIAAWKLLGNARSINCQSIRAFE